MKFNTDQFWGSVQFVLVWLLGLVAGKGWIPSDMIGHISLIVLTGLMWLAQHNWNGTPGTTIKPGDGKIVSLLFLFLLSAFCLRALTGCADVQQAGANPIVRAVAKEVAVAAIHFGLNQLGDRVKEARPYIPIIEANIPFAQPGAPAADAKSAALQISSAVSRTQAPAQMQDEMRAAIAAALRSPPASGPNAPPAAAPGDREYAHAIGDSLASLTQNQARAN